MTGFWDGNGISWTMCKQSAPRSRQITAPTPHHSIFTGRMLFLTPNEQCRSSEGSLLHCLCAGFYGSEWQWHQLGDIQVCTSLQTDNRASNPALSFFTGWMPFLSPNEQHQSTEGNRCV